MRQPKVGNLSATPIASQTQQPLFAHLAGNEVGWHTYDEASIGIRACVLCSSRLPRIQLGVRRRLHDAAAARRSGRLRTTRHPDRQTGCHDEELAGFAHSIAVECYP